MTLCGGCTGRLLIHVGEPWPICDICKGKVVLWATLNYMQAKQIMDDEKIPYNDENLKRYYK